MVKLDSNDLFDAAKNAQTAGVLELLPQMEGRIAPGDRFFESFQAYLLETYDLEQLDNVLYNLAPTIRYMSEEAHWEPQEFAGEEMFQAVKNLQKMGVFELCRNKTKLPGAGDRYFEYYQDILVNKIGVEALDHILHIMGQCIRFLSTDAALENVNE